MLSKNASSLSQDDLQTQANAYFKALFNRPEAANIVITASYTTDGGTSLTVNGSADVPTTFLNVLGYKELTVDSSSTTRWGSSRLRVALVLDNTGSMKDDGKIDALQTATKNLLTQLQNAVSTPGDVYVSVIPFVKDVSVDPTNYNSSWDSWIQWDDGTDNSWDGSNGTCSVGNKSPRSTCTAQSYCSISGYNSQSSCTNAGTCSIPAKRIRKAALQKRPATNRSTRRKKSPASQTAGPGLRAPGRPVCGRRQHGRPTVTAPGTVALLTEAPLRHPARQPATTRM